MEGLEHGTLTTIETMEASNILARAQVGDMEMTHGNAAIAEHSRRGRQRRSRRSGHCATGGRTRRVLIGYGVGTGMLRGQESSGGRESGRWRARYPTMLQEVGEPP